MIRQALKFGEAVKTQGIAELLDAESEWIVVHARRKQSRRLILAGTGCL